MENAAIITLFCILLVVGSLLTKRWNKGIKMIILNEMASSSEYISSSPLVIKTI